MTAADEAYDRLHGLDGHLQHVPRARQQVRAWQIKAVVTALYATGATPDDGVSYVDLAVAAIDALAALPAEQEGLMSVLLRQAQGGDEAAASIARVRLLCESALRRGEPIEPPRLLAALPAEPCCDRGAVTPCYTPAKGAALAAAYNEGWNTACDYLSDGCGAPLRIPPNPYEDATPPAEQEGCCLSQGRGFSCTCPDREQEVGW